MISIENIIEKLNDSDFLESFTFEPAENFDDYIEKLLSLQKENDLSDNPELERKLINCRKKLEVCKEYWNPWHGCKKKSEGCLNCFMFYKDSLAGKDGSIIFRNDKAFHYPLAKNDKGEYKVKTGEILRVSMLSDFFIEEADEWREEAWDIIRERKDVIFFLLTKRPERIENCLPTGWNEGWDNVICGVSCENQKRVEERIPILVSLPFKHRQIMMAPLIGEASILKYLGDSKIELVVCDEENYSGNRPCRKEWVEKLYNECVLSEVSFRFEGVSIKEKYYYRGKPMIFDLLKNGERFRKEIRIV